MAACRASRTEIAKLLVRKVTNLNAKNKVGHNYGSYFSTSCLTHSRCIWHSLEWSDCTASCCLCQQPRAYRASAAARKPHQCRYRRAGQGKLDTSIVITLTLSDYKHMCIVYGVCIHIERIYTADGWS